MVMVVNIFELSKKMKPADPLSLVYMSGATLMSALAIFTMSIELKPEAPEEEEPHKTKKA